MPDRPIARRDFLREASLSAAGVMIAPTLLGGCAPAVSSSLAPTSTAWARVPEILARIRPPVFPSRDFPVTSYGAVGDGTTDGTEAFGRAIAACSAAGGGRVVVPAGRFLTGPIHLRSNVNLHVERGGTVAFHTDPRRYVPLVFTRWEGVELYGYSPFVYAFEQQNVAITGEGTLDGQATTENWWPWKGGREWGRQGIPHQAEARAQLFRMAEENAPVAQRRFGEGSYLRPQFIQPYRCRNVLIEGVTILNSPMWEINPVLCQNVTVRNVKIVSHGPNNDGCDPESCRDVLIEGCLFDTGDDCIALKSGRNADGRRINVPIENVIVRNCDMKDGHGGVTIGSEISGGARYVFAENCRMSSPNLDRALRIKTNAMRGGVVEHIYMRDVTVGQVADAVVHVDFYYEEGLRGNFTPVVRNVDVRNVTSGRSDYALYLRGFPNAPITGVRLEDCTFENVATGNWIEAVQGLELIDVVINGRKAAAVASS